MIFDIVIIGAGPAGLACGIEAQKAGFSYCIVDKGAIAESIRRYPVNMTFFSTPDLLTLGNIPFPITSVRPSRAEALQYYRAVAEHFSLELRLRSNVLNVQKKDDGLFHVLVENENEPLLARFVVVATGYFDYVNKLDVEGEHLPHVTHYYDEPYKYVHSNVVVIGGRNSAVETALDLYRHGVHVTMVHRKPQLGESVKYWIKPDIQNRIAKGEIVAKLGYNVVKIDEKYVYIQHGESGLHESIPADFVIAHTGHRPDEGLFSRLGISYHPTSLVPEYNPETFETRVEGLFIAGSVACGCETWNIFIENGRLHGISILQEISKRM